MNPYRNISEVVVDNNAVEASLLSSPCLIPNCTLQVGSVINIDAWLVVDVPTDESGSFVIKGVLVDSPVCELTLNVNNGSRLIHLQSSVTVQTLSGSVAEAVMDIGYYGSENMSDVNINSSPQGFNPNLSTNVALVVTIPGLATDNCVKVNQLVVSVTHPE